MHSTTLYTYNTAGDVTATTYADNSVERTAYDVQGNPDVLTNRRGQTNNVTVNAAGQLTHEARSDGTTADYTYDTFGRLRTATEASGTTTLSYDDADRLTRVEYPNGRWLQYTYDAAGRRTGWKTILALWCSMPSTLRAAWSACSTGRTLQ